MCRHVARLGPAVSLHELLYEPAHSLLVQSYAPRLQRHGRVNADGFGVGWYVQDRQQPARYRRAQPFWTDTSFASIAEVISSRCVLAAVRDATIGSPVEESCTPPFAADRWLFSHNGAVQDQAGLRAHAATTQGLPDDLEVRVPVDSALLFGLALARWRAGASLGEGLAETVKDVAPVAQGRLNLLATDGRQLAATVYGDTLFTRTDADADAVVLASEPYDDAPDWREVPDRSLVTTHPGGVDIRRLDI